MQAETRTRICPLCRRPADDGASPSTRLCRDCRSMIEPILPRAGLVQTDYAVTLAASPSLAPTLIAPQPMHEADFEDVSFAPARDFRTGDFRVHPATHRPAESTQPAFVHDADSLAPEDFSAPDQYEDDEISLPLAAAPLAPARTPSTSFEATVSAPDPRPNVIAPDPCPVQPAPIADV